jgi:hypothetical protein
MKPTVQMETVCRDYVLEAEDGTQMRVTCTMEKENACHVALAFLEFYDADGLPHRIVRIRPVSRRGKK